ncbi:MAG: POTRA domain-containing protein [Luteolibacter sp.]|uniref:ShlB/FhaC/HecB family hemolysin secretion/activation protein n=1 Tax=Luteolibacter sp. TaxID=1962973 RepID=UPI003267E50D
MTFYRTFPTFSWQFNAVRTAISCLCVGFVTQFLSAQEITTFYVREYRVEGAKRLKGIEVEEAVYPFLGPGRGAEDVEQARVALEKVYHDKGFETVSVVIPQQDPRRGVIRLQVVEATVGRLRVNGARFFLPSKIKAAAPSVAEGQVPDMNQVQKEIVALNRLGDRAVKPELRAGVEPGTVDIDLNVEDKRPLHGSLELNNRYSADTTALRLNGSLSYGNLFQLGHTLNASFQIAPENLDDAQVYSGYYQARVSEKLSLMLQGTKQNSDVSTLGGAAVGGRGEIVGLRGVWDLPVTDTFYQSFSFGMDYKNFQEDIVVGKDTVSSPIEYYPLVANYNASWIGKDGFTELNHSLNFHLRGMGSSETDYANKRYEADGDYVYLRSDLSHVHDLKGGSQLFGKVQGQIASRPLVNGEQIAGGGLESVRGYLEATALGDNGVFGTVEFRSPSFIGTPDANGKRASEWRLHAFADGGLVGIYDALPSQQSQYGFASVGGGTRFMLLNHYNGSLDVGVPLISQTHADNGDVRVTFRGWADF